jgi:integrase
MLAKRKYRRLTALEVKRLAGRPGWHADGDGLWLKVEKTGSASWVRRYYVGAIKKERYLGLGAIRHVGLAEARELNDAARRLWADGVDPIDAKHDKVLGARLKTARSMTFRQCAERYIADHHCDTQWSRSFENYVYPLIGDLSVAAIDTGLVRKVLDPIWGTKNVTADRVRGRIEAVLSWAATSGYRTGENPARWRDHLENLLAKKTKVHSVEHHAALPYAEIGAFMAKLRGEEGVPARALEFAILTAARRGEVLGARWDELKPNNMWVVPKERMKAGKEHRVPLSADAVAIIDKMRANRKSDFVFPGTQAGRPLAHNAMAKELIRLGSEVTSHGFRSSFRDWARETTEHAREACELALAHNVGTAVEEAYARGPMVAKRRELMEDWAGHCGRLPDQGGADKGIVVAFAR